MGEGLAENGRGEVGSVSTLRPQCQPGVVPRARAHLAHRAATESATSAFHLRAGIGIAA